MNISELLQLYLSWCADHRAPATVRAYQGRLKSLAAKFPDRQFRDLSPLEIEAWLREADRFADGRPKAADTRRLNAAAYEAFQTWAIGRAALDKPILAKIEKPASRERQRIPTEAETASLLEHASPQFRTIYQALRVCAARPNELCRATWAHYDRENAMIELAEHKTGRKTGKPRLIVVGAQLAKLIGDPPDPLDPTAPLFRSPEGRPWTPQRLSAIYRTLRDKVGLTRELVLYCARHESITAVANAKGIHVASRFAGHSSLKTTMRYAKTSTEELRAAQDVIRIDQLQPPAKKEPEESRKEPAEEPDISRETPPEEEPPAKAA